MGIFHFRVISLIIKIIIVIIIIILDESTLDVIVPSEFYIVIISLAESVSILKSVDVINL